MIREIDATSFTKRLYYPVNEIPAREFLAALENYAQKEKTKAYMKEMRTKFHQAG